MKASEGRVAIVTGAARPWGLGRAAALGLAGKGCDIVVADVRDDWGEEAAKAIEDSTGQRAIYVNTDVSQRDSVTAMVGRVTAEFGRIDALVNVAGVLIVERIDDIQEDSFSRLVNINLWGTILTCQAVLPQMRNQGGGRIVNTAAAGALRPVKGLGAYAATKGGVITFSKVLATEVARDNVIVVVVSPGPINTAMGSDNPPEHTGEARASLGMVHDRMLSPEDVAEDIVFAATEAGMTLTGQTLQSNGGFLMV